LELAAAVLRRGLQELNGDALRAGPMLSDLVEVELQRGDVDAARLASGELAALVEHAAVPTLGAEASPAEARIPGARGDLPAAQDAFAAAKSPLSDGERPFQLAVIRLELAGVLATAGEPSAAIVEARAALATFDRLGAASSRDRAAALLRTLGDTG